MAVLPMTSIVGNSDLASGLRDQVAFELFRVPGVWVMSRRGVARCRGQRDVDPRKIGEASEGHRWSALFRRLSTRVGLGDNTLPKPSTHRPFRASVE